MFTIMGLFHYSQLVGNWVFFVGREQCLQSWLGSVVVSWLFHRPWTNLYPDLGSAHLETVLSWISIACRSHFTSCPNLLPSWKNFLACHGQIPGHPLPTSVHTNQPFSKANRPVVNTTDLTWTLPIKTASLPVFSCRVGNI